MLRTCFSVLACVLVISGCTNKDADKNSNGTQVAAKVNKEEISVHQVNNVLSRLGNVKPDQAKAASRQVLDKLIEQELLVQQATERKLDRDPRVMQTIEASKREILARAYLEQIASNVAKADEGKVKEFYDKNPALFRERRVYNLQEIVISGTQEQSAAIENLVRQSKSMAEIASHLKEQNIQFTANAGLKTAEQLPMEALPKIHSLKDGQTTWIPSQGGLTLIHVVGSQSRPLDETSARPFIEQYLANQKRAEIAASEISNLKQKAKIQYVGDFAQLPDTAAGSSSTTTSQPAETKGDKGLEKGIQGLK